MPDAASMAEAERGGEISLSGGAQRGAEPAAISLAISDSDFLFKDPLTGFPCICTGCTYTESPEGGTVIDAVFCPSVERGRDRHGEEEIEGDEEEVVEEERFGFRTGL